LKGEAVSATYGWCLTIKEKLFKVLKICGYCMA